MDDRVRVTRCPFSVHFFPGICPSPMVVLSSNPYPLWYDSKKCIKKGQIVSIYLIWYGIVRGIIETFRTDSLMIANVKVAQVLSVVMISAGVYIFFTQAKKPKLDDLYNSVDEEIIF